MSKRTSAAAPPAPPAPATLAELHLPDIRRRLRQGRRSALARACAAAPGVRVHDAFAGWGTDGLVLAALGCVVHMSERSPQVFRLLRCRLEQETGGRRGVTSALEDARSRWRQPGAFDVVYLDPMFGTHPKTALPGKHMQVLASLAAAVENLDAALQAARRTGARVVLKRRAGAKALLRPDWRIVGSSVRFDVYRPLAGRAALSANAAATPGAVPPR